MPRHIETFTTCAGPDVARPHTRMGGLAGFIIGAWYFSGALTIFVGLAFLTGLILASVPLLWSATAIAIIVALVEIKDWYYNERLLCIRERDCAVGTVISEPTAAFDGDRKLNLMLAPYTQMEIEYEILLDHLERNRTMLSDPANFTAPFHSAVESQPTLMTMQSNRTEFKGYMARLAGKDPDDADASSPIYDQITIGAVDTLLLPTNVNAAGEPKNFYQRYFRKDAGAITDVATFNAIPTDFDTSVNWQSPDAQSSLESPNPVTGDPDPERLNPQFRYADNPMVPYLHCEVEGNYLAVLLDSFIVALTAFAIAAAFLGPLGGLIVGVLAWLFKKLIDWLSGNDGDADEPDVDWDDPDFPGVDGVTETTGDVVAVYGNWIMDTEHHQYFEIHPVRAYYLLATNARGGDEPILTDGNEEQIVIGPNYDPTLLNAEMADTICKDITAAETSDTQGTIERKGSEVLSYGTTTNYAGGGQIALIG